MSEPNPEWLILAIVLIALGLAPLASRLVGQIGEKVSGEVGGGPDDERSESAARADEIAQMQEARAYLRSRRAAADGEIETVPDAPEPPDDDLREEVRQVVVANNERRERRGEDPLDVEAETDRRLAALQGHS